MTKQTPKQLQNKIWNECKRIIRFRYPHNCYTCGAENLTGSNLQTGHMVAKKYLPYNLKYDLRFLRPQCMTCNLRYGGMGAIFLYKMMEENDNEARDDIHRFFNDIEYEKKEQKECKPNQKEVIEFYTNLLERLKLIKK